LLSWDDASIRRMTGKTLMFDSLIVTIDGKPGAALYTYRRIS